MASASANTSRPQPFACDIGERNKPSAARGPKPSALIMQPATKISRMKFVRADDWLGFAIDMRTSGSRRTAQSGGP